LSNLTTLGLVLAAGGLAGALGGLLGLGGGVFLVPFLNLALGLGFKQAVAVSLMTVIATSSVVSARTAGRQLINLRLGMVLEVATAAGGLAGGVTAQLLADRLLQALFALATAAIAVVMLRRLDLPAAREAEGLDVGRLGGRYIDERSGREIRYCVQRLPVALGVSFVAGNVSSLLGIGGGVLKVPALNAWCGVPMRAAAATSAFMIGVTAAAALPIYWAGGHLAAPLAAAAVLGVLGGSRAGLWLAARAPERWLKLLMAVVLATVAAAYAYRVLVAR
jgi:uncharacterized membrane protein YfcA